MASKIVAMCVLSVGFLAAEPEVGSLAQSASRREPAFMALLRPPPPSVALEAPLAAKLADRLGWTWFGIAAPSCRAERSLELANYHALARKLLVAVGERMRTVVDDATDVAKAEAEFATQAGPDAVAEMRRLAESAPVVQFLALLRAGAAVDKTQQYLEWIERALVLSRIQTQAMANPLATGDSELLLEIEAVSSAALDFADRNNGPEINRFLELATLAGAALTGAGKSETLLSWGPGKLMDLLEGPLRDHCIGVR